ncbi:Hypothetical predicted protein [Pelobates cultripes]|uniref:Uncharacterized protein n=1 Tax=Pelobates cultripes TaxID=61616 RepID=A0AAD1RYQ8_PELCU|nr:Hypothetical predicted protein [Pelobates cultripes]
MLKFDLSHEAHCSIAEYCLLQPEEILWRSWKRLEDCGKAVLRRHREEAREDMQLRAGKPPQDKKLSPIPTQLLAGWPRPPVSRGRTSLQHSRVRRLKRKK